MITFPETVNDSYTQANKDDLQATISWLNENNKSQAWLSRLASIKAGTLSQLLNGKYPSDPGKFIEDIIAAVEQYTRRADKEQVEFVETSVYKLASVVCGRARTYQNFGVLIGYVGVGKTYCLEHYAESHPHTILIETDPNMTPGLLLGDILKAMVAPVIKEGKGAPSLSDKFRSCVDALKGTSILIIVDEADRIQERCLHYLRRIRDKAKVGIVLAGNEGLTTIIKGSNGNFDQIRSRVGFWPKIIQGADRADLDAVAMNALLDQGELDQEILDRLWAYTDGSIRMLTENLIPALRDYGLKKYPLSADLIDQVATKVIFLPRAK